MDASGAGGGGGGGGGISQAMSPFLAAQLNKQAAEGSAAAVQKMRDDALARQKSSFGDYQANLLKLYSQFQNPALTGAFGGPQSIGSAPQAGAAQLGPGGQVSSGGGSGGSPFQFQAPDYARILAMMQGGAPPGGAPGQTATSPPPDKPPLNATGPFGMYNAQPGGVGFPGGGTGARALIPPPQMPQRVPM